MSKRIWRVELGDEQYTGNHYSYLLSGDTAATVEKKGMALAKETNEDLLPTEKKVRPYIEKITLVGDLDD